MWHENDPYLAVLGLFCEKETFLAYFVADVLTLGVEGHSQMKKLKTRNSRVSAFDAVNEIINLSSFVTDDRNDSVA